MSLILSELDDRIDQAAQNTRPELRDTDPLPGGSVIKFAPMAATYKVLRDGGGTVVYLYGTEQNEHTIAVRVEHFRPYLYVSLSDIDKHTQDETLRKKMIQMLVDELNQQLLLSCAFQEKSYADEITAFREAEVGYVRGESIARGDKKRFTLHPARKHCKPIVDYAVRVGLPIKGTGANSGYAGTATIRFLQIFFYCPSLVSKARSLLHNKNADKGSVIQAYRLSQGHGAGGPNEQAADDASKQMRAANALDPKQRSLMSQWCPEPSDPAVLDDGDEHDEGAVATAIESEFEMRETVLDAADENDVEFELDPAAEQEQQGGAVLEEDEDDIDPAGEVHEVAIDDAGETEDELRKTVVERFKKQMLDRARTTKLHMLAPGNTYAVYEADIDFTLRFAIDCGFSYEQWISIDTDKELHTWPNGRPTRVPFACRRVYLKDRETRAQIELRCDYRLLEFNPKDPIQNTMPKHRIVSLDCEMAPGPNNEFPTPERDKMLQCVFIIKGRSLTPAEAALVTGIANKDNKIAPENMNRFEYRSVSFTLLDCDCRADLRPFCTERFILSFAEEETMFRAIARFIRLLDVDIVTGYNIDTFDLPWMLSRAKVLGAVCGTEFERAWGRSLRSSRMTVRQRVFESSQAGKVVFTDVRAEGLVVLDMIKKLQRDPLIKLRSYSLNAVAAEYVGAEKEDVSYARINEMQATGSVEREKLRSYCEKDALLPLEIAESPKLKVMEGMIESARINVCPIEVLLTRGQQVRSKCALYKIARVQEPQLFFYTRSDEERAAQANETFKGAKVIDPKPGLYRMVVTLDWAGLYPAIMITFNLCPTTRVRPGYDLTTDLLVQRCKTMEELYAIPLTERQRRAREAVYVACEVTQEFPYAEAPFAGAPVFLKHSVKVGIVPLAQQIYSAHRSAAKAEMEAAKKVDDHATAALLNQRQQALKLLGNSLYGLLGATSAFLYSREVAEEVTRRGRELLFQMRADVLTEFKQHAPEVIYGDTDSNFVALHNVKSLDEAAAIGVQMARYVTAHMKRLFALDAPQYNVLKLEFEKVFSTLVLIAKKRYAGMKYEYSAKDGSLKPSPEPGVPYMSGLESKRRDTTLLVAQNITDFVAILLDDKTPVRENMERARGYAWHHMVRPLLDNTINLRLLVITKQLRMSMDEYVKKAKGGLLPNHVQLWQKLIERAGGPDAQNAPRAGTRIPLIVGVGSKYDKVSTRAEDPVYALEHGIPPDARYYLDKHVRPTLLRIMVPVLASMSQQRRLTEQGGTETHFGKTEAARQRASEAEAAQYLFGDITGYKDPVSETNKLVYARIVPATRLKDPLPTQRPRYTQQRLNTEDRIIVAKSTGAVSRQRTLASFVATGARCTQCKKFYAGAQEGHVCAACAGGEHAARGVKSTIRRHLLDIEELYSERAELADTCHECMGCRSAPQEITCTNTDCKVLWDRKQNEKSRIEVERRLDAAYETAYAIGALERLDLGVN